MKVVNEVYLGGIKEEGIANSLNFAIATSSSIDSLSNNTEYQAS